MAIERFVWTFHAEQRLDERHLTRGDVEQAIRDGHSDRKANDGRADWLVVGLTVHGAPLEAAYDHPVGDDERTARVVSAWRQS